MGRGEGKQHDRGASHRQGKEPRFGPILADCRVPHPADIPPVPQRDATPRDRTCQIYGNKIYWNPLNPSPGPRTCTETRPQSPARSRDSGTPTRDAGAARNGPRPEEAPPGRADGPAADLPWHRTRHQPARHATSRNTARRRHAATLDPKTVPLPQRLDRRPVGHQQPPPVELHARHARSRQAVRLQLAERTTLATQDTHPLADKPARALVKHWLEHRDTARAVHETPAERPARSPTRLPFQRPIIGVMLSTDKNLGKVY